MNALKKFLILISIIAICGIGAIIDYFIALKVNEAKKLLQEGNVSITQISDTLGYSTIHHFSHSFKKCIGMSPSEYKKSLSPKASKTK